MVFTAFVSLVAGLLTVLAPCVLPLLPVILGGSVVRDGHDRWRPYMITGSLVASLVLFTLLLKASTALIGIDPRVWVIATVLPASTGLGMLYLSVYALGVGAARRASALLGRRCRSRGTWAS